MSATAMEVIADRLRDHGKKVITRATGFSAQCPSHDDHNPSLSVMPRRDGDGAVLVCHAGCDYHSILDAIGLQDRDLFDATGLRDAYNSHRTYDYPDGRKVERKPKQGGGKTFWQSGNKKGTSLFGSDHVTTGVDTVFVVEGEKDVCAALALGAVAVCGAMGAGKANLFDWSPLDGKHVIIVADDDEPGRAHAKDVAEIVRRTALSTRIVQSAVGKDFADHIANDRTLADLVDVAKPQPTALAFDAVTLSDVRPEKVEWLWLGWLPVGKVVTLDGDPGLGKSTLALTFAATVTTAGQWPDGTRCIFPGDVILMSAEDGLADTVRPRLDSARGDATRVHAIQGVPLISDEGETVLRMPTLNDIAQLRDLIVRTGARLVIVDVLMAYLPSGTDSHRDQDVRRVLARLSALADETRCTILLLRHLNKSKGGDPMYRGGGSIGIVGASRVGLMVAPDPDEEKLRVLACLKNNLAAMPESRSYSIVPDDLYDVSHIQWEGISQHDAHTLLADQDTTVDTGVGSEAKNWLEDYLEEQGRTTSKDAKVQGMKQAGLSQRSVERAAGKLRVKVESEGFPRVTYWSLPQHSHASSQETGATGATGATEDDQQLYGDDVGATADTNDTSRASAASDAVLGTVGVTGEWDIPKGLDRCPACGFHVPTQGHRDECPATATPGKTKRGRKPPRPRTARAKDVPMFGTDDEPEGPAS